MGFARVAIMGALLGFGSIALGCGDDANGGDDDVQEAVECCMLRQLASHCSSPNSTSGLMESVRQWREVGNSGNASACKAMINSEDNGCTGLTLQYDEQDAIVDCS